MALHIKTIETNHEGSRLFATLTLVRQDDGKIGIAVRLTEAKKGGRERSIGTARLSPSGELANFEETLTKSQRDLLERAIAEALS